MIKYFNVALFFAACLAVSNCFGDTNILANPGFEDSSAWGGRGCTLTYATEQKLSGNSSGKATGRTDTWQGIRQSILGKAQPGKTYQISGWVRLENAIRENVIVVSVEQKDDKGTNYINVASTIANDSNWFQLSGSFTLSVTGTLEVLDVYFEGPPADVNFYVDDANVFGPSAEMPAAPPAGEPNKPADTNAKDSPERTALNTITRIAACIFNWKN